ncbi:MAG: serine/threonine-protein kinase [Acidobacteriota bacterium]
MTITPGAPLDADRWRRVAGVVEVAIELDPATRAAYLESWLGRDEALHRRALQILRAMDIIAPRDEPAQDEASAALDASRDRIGPWRIVRLLGRGGMGAVFLAERDDEAFERQVAVKVIGAGFQTPQVYRRFLAERQILAAFDQPNIAKLFDGGTARDGRPYLVMEYIDGLAVDAYCYGHDLSLEDRIGLFLKICGAVGYAHRQLVIHRDLKPSNILVTPDGEPKLLDFGIAKLLEPGAFLSFEVEATRTTQAVMTPNWASPEQLRGGAISTSSDIYSLGLLLYKLLTGALPGRSPKESGRTPGRRPASGAVAEDTASGEGVTRPSRALSEASPLAVGTAVAWSDRRRPGVAQSLRGDLDNIVLKALRPEPERRYATVEAMVDDLQRYLDGRPVSATRDTPLYLGRKLLSRYRWQMIALALFIVAVVGTAGAALWRAEDLRRERDQTRRAKEQAETQALRAERQASRAAGSLQFLADLLRAADATERAQENLSVQDLLLEGLERLEAGAVEAPEAKVELLGLIGDAFFDFRDLTTAVRAFKLAVVTAQEAEFPRHQLDELLARLAQLQIYANDQANIRETCEALLEGTSPEVRVPRQRCLIALEYLAQFEGDVAEMVTLKRRLLDETDLAGEFGEPEIRGLVTWAELCELGLEDARVSISFLEDLGRLAIDRLEPDRSDAFLVKIAFDLFRLETKWGDLSQADRLLKWADVRRPESHPHDTVLANDLLLAAALDRQLGRIEDAHRRIDEAQAIGRSMLEIDPGDLRARFIVATAPAWRAAIFRDLGDRRRELDALERAIGPTRQLLEESGGNFLVKRRLVTQLLSADRLDEATPLALDLLGRGYRNPAFIELARAKGVLPDPLPPGLEFERSIAPRLLAALDQVAHLQLPWEIDGAESTAGGVVTP